MQYSKTSDDDFLAMSELTHEIGNLVQKNLDQGRNELTSLDVEHILKMTTDVTMKIKSQTKEITA